MFKLWRSDVIMCVSLAHVSFLRVFQLEQNFAKKWEEEEEEKNNK